MGTDIMLEQLQATLDELDGWLGGQRRTDPTEADHARQNLDPVVQLAGDLAAEYRNFLIGFRSVLERMSSLDADALRTGRFADALGDVAGDAARLIKRVEQSIAILQGIPARAGAWTQAKERTRLSDRLSKEVQEHVGGAQRAVAQVEILRERITRFLVAQRTAI